MRCSEWLVAGGTPVRRIHGVHRVRWESRIIQSTVRCPQSTNVKTEAAYRPQVKNSGVRSSMLVFSGWGVRSAGSNVRPRSGKARQLVAGCVSPVGRQSPMESVSQYAMTLRTRAESGRPPGSSGPSSWLVEASSWAKLKTRTGGSVTGAGQSGVTSYVRLGLGTALLQPLA